MRFASLRMKATPPPKRSLPQSKRFRRRIVNKSACNPPRFVYHAGSEGFSSPPTNKILFSPRKSFMRGSVWGPTGRPDLFPVLLNPASSPRQMECENG